MNCLSPSLLAADFARLGQQVALIDQAGAQYVHIDVMDGMFVPSISMGLPVIKSIRPVSDRIFDVHLMVQDPEKCIDDYVEAGADLITVHAEACRHLDRTIRMIKEQDIIAGVALNPSTPLSAIEYLLPVVDMVLIMTVNPGYGGQKLISYTLDKIRDLKKMIDSRGLKTDIEVDGGITMKNLGTVMDAGANIIVSGSSVFQGDGEESVKEFLLKPNGPEHFCHRNS